MNDYYGSLAWSETGRVKGALMQTIAADVDRMPSERALVGAIMDRWKHSPLSGELLYCALFPTAVQRVDETEPLDVDTIEHVLEDIARGPVVRRANVDIALRGDRRELTMAGVVLGHELTSGATGYYVSLSTHEQPDEAAMTSIVIDTSPMRRHHFAVLEREGWRGLAPQEACGHPAVEASLAAIGAVVRARRPLAIPIASIKHNEEFAPPVDPELDRLLQLAHCGALPVSEGLVDIEHVTPFSHEHCFRIPVPLVEQVVVRIDESVVLPLVLYWSGETFVMSDSYPQYLAYRKRRVSRVPAIILGEAPPTRVQNRRSGGAELIPPVLCAVDGPTSARTSIDVQAAIDAHFGIANRSSIPSDAFAVWLKFATLLADESTTESAVHQFLLGHPEALSCYATSPISEYRLGGEYRIDLILPPQGVDPRVTLVELESPKHSLFTASGRPRKEVTHAKQQVEDWIRWLREQPHSPLSIELKGLPPRGMVVIGRSLGMTADTRARLAHINANSAVSMITYDELLDQLGEYILGRSSSAEI